MRIIDYKIIRAVGDPYGSFVILVLEIERIGPTKI